MATFRNFDNGTVGVETLRDYQHAARIFTDSNFRLSPKYGFLFYVEFDFNPLITEITNISAQELGMLVKNVALPKYTIDVKQHNAYNRKNYVQNSIKYDPVTITFHDDQADNVREFWYDYYSYYYRDPDYADATYSAYTKYQSRPTFDWGYTPRPAIGYNSSTGVQPYQYIQAIRIYSLYQSQFDEYTLINPIITGFKHGEHQQGNEGGLLENQMTVQFETVKYKTGYVTANTAGGFVDLHYDSTPSPNGGTPAADTNSQTITDLANNNTSINPSLRTDQALQATAFNPASAIGSFLGGATLGSLGGGGINGGGFSIPSFGSLNQGIPSSQYLNQQLVAGATNIAGTTAASLANGIGQAIGPTGKTIVGLAAAAITNPSGFARTAENMAIGYGVKLATNYVSGQINSLINGPDGLTSQLNSGITYLNNSLGSSIFGEGQSFTSGLSSSATGAFNYAEAAFNAPSAETISASQQALGISADIPSTGEFTGSIDF